MRQNRRQVLDWIGISEGGYVNHPRDPGGATDRGITQRTYDAWNDLRGRERRPVRGISKEEAEEILASQYFDPIRFDDLPSGLDYAMADYAVNSGPGRAARDLQRVLGVTVDGAIGAQTLAAVAAADVPGVIRDLCLTRMRFLQGLSTFDTFGRGWTTRVMGRIEGIQDEDIGVIDRASRMARGQDAPAPVVAAPGRAEADPEPRGRSVLADPAMIGALAPAVGSVATMSQGDGPIQWAVAAVLMVAAAVVVWHLVKRTKRAEAAL